METNQNQNTEFIQSVNDFLHSKKDTIRQNDGKIGMIVIALEEDESGEGVHSCIAVMGQGGMLVRGLAEFVEKDAKGDQLLKEAARMAMLNKVIKGLGGKCDCEDCRNKSEHTTDVEQTPSTESEEQTA